MPSTYNAIATATATGSTQNFTFSSIPATFTDLRIIISGRSDEATAISNCNIYFNNASGVSGQWVYMWSRGQGNQTTPAFAANSTNSVWFPVSTFAFPAASGASTNANAFFIIDVLDYRSSWYKIAYLEGVVGYALATTTNNRTGNSVGMWKSSAVINRIDLQSGGAANWAAGTTATLYGILRA